MSDDGDDDAVMADDEESEVADADPFENEEEFDDDSWIEPAQLMARILHPEVQSSASDSSLALGAADNVEIDLAAAHVPDGEDLGRGKRRRVSTKKFDGFLGH